MTITLTNGLISREFATTPDFGTVDYRSEIKAKSLLRAIYPEATVTLDGTQYAIGGLQADIKHSYLNRSALQLSVNPNAFHFAGYTTTSPVAPFHWEPGLRGSPRDVSWPPKGLTLHVIFKAPDSVKLPQHANVIVYMNYEMYVGIPLMAKWMSVVYTEDTPIRIDGATVEYLGTQKPYAPFSYNSYLSPWTNGPGLAGSWLYVETSEAHGNKVRWGTDPLSGLSPGSDEPLLNC